MANWETSKYNSCQNTVSFWPVRFWHTKISYSTEAGAKVVAGALSVMIREKKDFWSVQAIKPREPNSTPLRALKMTAGIADLDIRLGVGLSLIPF